MVKQLDGQYALSVIGKKRKGMNVYLIGSLRNPEVPKIANSLREEGFEVFDDWYAAGPEADDKWQDYEKGRGRTYEEALEGHAAKHVFEFDKQHLERCDAVILVLPAGKSGHLELGWGIGKGKLGYILLDSPERWDVMYQFANVVTSNLDDIVTDLKKDRTIVIPICQGCPDPIRFGDGYVTLGNAKYMHMDCYTESLDDR